MISRVLFQVGFCPRTADDVSADVRGGMLLSADVHSLGDQVLSDMARLACERPNTDVWGIDPAGMAGIAEFTSRCAATTEAAEKLLTDLQEVVTHRFRVMQDPGPVAPDFHDVVLIVNHFPAGSTDKIVTMLGQIAGGQSKYGVHLVLRVRRAYGDAAAAACRRWLHTRMVLRVTDPEELGYVFDRRPHGLDPFGMGRPGMGAIAAGDERPSRVDSFHILSQGGSQQLVAAPMAVGPFKLFPLLNGVKIKLGGEWQPGIYDGVVAAAFAAGYIIRNGADSVRELWHQVRQDPRTLTMDDLITLPRDVAEDAVATQ